MRTPLTMLFPDAYALIETASGALDEIALASPADATQTILISGPISSRDTIFVRGWAIDGAEGKLASGVLVTLGGQVVEAVYGHPRPDVAANLGSETFVASGFRAVIAPLPGTTGVQAIRAYAVSADALHIAQLAGEISVTIRPADAPIAIELPKTAGFVKFHLDELAVVNGHDDGDGHGENGVRAAGSLHAKRGATIKLRGWGFDTSAALPVRGVYLVIDGRDLVHGTLRYPRDDVAQAERNGNIRECGFVIRYDTAGLPVGPHGLRLGFISHDGLAHDELDLPQMLRIIPELA